MSSTWESLVSAGEARVDVDLAPHTTYKLGGPARLFVDVGDRGLLERVVAAHSRDPQPLLVLGRGSNLLIAESGFAGVVVRLGSGFGTVDIGANGTATAGGSVPLPRLARALADSGRGGMEWGVGVPGSVGGAVRQNAGCFGVEVVDRLIEAEVVSLATGEQDWRPAANLDLSYRHSSIEALEVVVAARFDTAEADPEESRREMLRVTRWRKENQPGGTLNAGSVFKNPPGEAAGALIDRLGLKGFTVGPVRVSPRHANFVEASAGSSPADVRALIEEVRDRVLAESGVALEREIQYVGFDGEAG